MAGIIWQALIMCYHLTHKTSVYSVEDDVAGVMCGALRVGRRPG